MKKRILVTGASGMLGATLVKLFQDKFQVYATSSGERPLDFIVNYLPFDLSEHQFDRLIAWSKPDFIIHCAALTNGNYCNEHPDEAMQINGLSLQKFRKAMNAKTHLIYICTDAVFANDKHFANENDAVNPESVYGKSKELGEFFLNHSEKKFTIVRTTIVGKNLNEKKTGFVEWMVNASKSNETIALFDDVLFTPISIWNFATQLEYIINNPSKFSRKTVHIAGSEICTKYDFGMAVLKSLNLPIANVEKGKIADFADRAKRSSDQSLNCSYFQDISGRKLPNLKQTVNEIKSHFE